ncbi:FtsW/RodA/SpoVE family cell cycle protein [Bengtsoniella intestinalis]|uniref:FtsW/RodA/SpoVE family cell cycle protein n=1 Tax=Bengtsoniella intestinalis TaxID=3073143 RepID=UPI00391F50AC
MKKLKAILIDFLQQADLVLLALCCVSTIFGIVMIHSATQFMNSERYVIVQTCALGIGIVLYILLSVIDVESVIKKWPWFVAFNICFMLLLIPFGVDDGTGNKAWLKLPGVPVSIGPAEVVKISFTMLLAKQLSWLKEEKRDLKSIKAIAFTGGHTLALVGLYFVLSGDMGNALVYLFIFAGMSIVAGMALRWFALAGTVAVGGLAFMWLFEKIPSYMLNRFIILYDHSYDPQGVGWQQTRSLLALGSGGLFGQGYMQGTQSQSAYSWSLPARWTDFIFSVIGEELGMVGCLVVLVLLSAIVLRCIDVSHRVQSAYASYICIGMAAMLMFQIMVNVGMCLFIMPVIGLTLPFFSYGGSSVVTLFCAMGIVSGIHKNAIKVRKPGKPLQY